MYLDVLAELIKLLGPFLLSMENGRASGGTSNTLVDNTKTWKTDMWKGAYVHIYDGTGKGQIRKIISNTSDTLTVDEDWTEIPDDTSKYRIFISFSEDSVVFQDIKSLIESINNKTVKVDTDNVKVVSEVAYDSDNDLKKIRIDVDNVGLAKEDTLSAIKNALNSVGTDKLLTIPDNPPNLDISLSALRDALKGANNKDFSTLQTVIESIKAQTDKLQFDANNLLRIALAAAEILQPTEIQSHWSEGVTLLASGARTTNGEGSDVDVERFICGELHLSVTAVSASGEFGAGEGLRVIVEGKDEITGDYKIIYDSADPNKSNIGEMITSPVDDWLPITMNAFKHLRVRWEISGTDPSFTFSVTMQGKA